MKNRIITTLIALLVVAGIAGIGYVGWQIEKRWNYSMSYEDMVKRTVREMVKPEALKGEK